MYWKNDSGARDLEQLDAVAEVAFGAVDSIDGSQQLAELPRISDAGVMFCGHTLKQASKIAGDVALGCAEARISRAMTTMTSLRPEGGAPFRRSPEFGAYVLEQTRGLLLRGLGTVSLTNVAPITVAPLCRRSNT